MCAMTRSLAALSLAALHACGTHGALAVPSSDAGVDARVSDVASADVVTDIARADAVALDAPRFERCPRGAQPASAVGSSLLGRFDYRFAWAGFESRCV